MLSTTKMLITTKCLWVFQSVVYSPFSNDFTMIKSCNLLLDERRLIELNGFVIFTNHQNTLNNDAAKLECKSLFNVTELNEHNGAKSMIKCHQYRKKINVYDSPLYLEEIPVLSQFTFEYFHWKIHSWNQFRWINSKEMV